VVPWHWAQFAAKVPAPSAARAADTTASNTAVMPITVIFILLIPVLFILITSFRE
jgi:hypothetical protein